MNDHLKTSHPLLSQKIEEELLMDTNKEGAGESKHAYIFIHVLSRKRYKNVHLFLLILMRVSVYIIQIVQKL